MIYLSFMPVLPDYNSLLNFLLSTPPLTLALHLDKYSCSPQVSENPAMGWTDWIILILKMLEAVMMPSMLYLPHLGLALDFVLSLYA